MVVFVPSSSISDSFMLATLATVGSLADTVDFDMASMLWSSMWLSELRLLRVSESKRFRMRLALWTVELLKSHW